MKYGYLYLGSSLAIVLIGGLLIFFIFGNGVLYGMVWTHIGVAESNHPVANYEIDFYSNDGKTLVGKTLSDANGNYSIQLPAGNYLIHTKDQLRGSVKVVAMQNTNFDILVMPN